MSVTDICIVGAGVAGLTCARWLGQTGHRVLILDKGRGLGGRLATRRVGDDLAFDHGAPHLAEVADPLLAEALAAGSLAPWPAAGPERWVGTPTMNAFLKPWAAAHDVRLSTEVAALAPAAGGWQLTLKSGETIQATRVVVTVPAVQARGLLAAVPEAAAALAQATMRPTWTLLIALATAPSQPAITAADALVWIARNSGKPGRPTGSECWVAHAGEAWTRANLEREKDDVAADLSAQFLRAVGSSSADVVYAATHRWRYAVTDTPLGRPFWRQGPLWVGGDWCLGPGIAHAVASGHAMAEDILAAG